MKKASDGSSEEAVAGRRRGGEALCLETFTRLACLLAAAEDFAEAREPGDDKQGEALLCRRRERDGEIETARAGQAYTRHTTSFPLHTVADIVMNRTALLVRCLFSKLHSTQVRVCAG